MPVQEVVFKNSSEHELRGVMKHPGILEEGTRFPAVLVLHTFSANKEHELVVNIANTIYPYGYATLRFDFHGHGESGGEFQDITIGQKIDDVRSAITFLQQQPMVDPDRIAVIGHGMGADVAILAAGQDERIKCLVVQGARSNLEEHVTGVFSPDEIKEYQTRGYLTHHTWGRMNKSFFDNFRRYDIIEEIKKVRCPILIVHGRNDFRVLWTNARNLYFAANEPKRLEIVDMADHWFRDPQHRQFFFDLMIKWLNHWIKGMMHYEAETTERRSRRRFV